MEILRAETNEFPHLKNTDGPKNNSSSSAASSASSSTIDDDDDDQFSNVSTTDDKRTIKSPVNNEDKSKINDENLINNSSIQTPIVQSIVNRTTSTIDYTRHRERLAKELKDYEDRWLAHRNFLLYTQAFSMKPEDRERLFSQINSTNNDETFSRLSKEERDRFLAAALYNQQQQQQQQPNPYNFHQYPWTTPSTTSSLLIPPIPSTTTTDQQQQQQSQQQQQQQPKSPSSDDSGNQSNSGSTTEW
ncbi:unnamed protein product [Rotaria sp. Silwood1]|nr:unnamed protein product [Rotaria sp. Silwood1]